MRNSWFLSIGFHSRQRILEKMKLDKIAKANKSLWENEVRLGCGYTVPWLHLDHSALKRYVSGQSNNINIPLDTIYPAKLLKNVENKRVLCLASGGGQQSAVFSLLGAQVTVVDFCSGQLEGDQKAADFYGYEINLVEADMRDLSCMQSGFYDLVFQAESLCYIPHVKEVFSQVSSLLKRGGRYRSAFHDPVAFSLEWDGVRYGLNRGYRQRELYREDGGVEFRHRLDEIFNGLLDEGFLIECVLDRSVHGQKEAEKETEPGTWNHEKSFVGGEFVIISMKPSASPAGKR